MTRRENPAAATQDELASFLDDVVELARSSAGIDAARLEEMKQRFRSHIEELGAGAKGAAQDILHHADDAIERADSYAREKPWNVAIAAGLVGLVIGVLVARR